MTEKRPSRTIDLDELVDALGEMHGNAEDDDAADVLMDAMLIVRRVKASHAAPKEQARARILAFCDAWEGEPLPGHEGLADTLLVVGNSEDDSSGDLYLTISDLRLALGKGSDHA